MQTESLSEIDKTYSLLKLPMSYVLQGIQIVEDIGVNRQQVLENTGFTDEEFASPERKVSFLKSKRLIENMERLTGAVGLGLYFGAKLSFAAHGMVGVAALSQKNLDHAKNIIIKYCENRFDGVTIESISEGQLSGFRWHHPFKDEKYSIYITEFIFASIYRHMKLVLPNEDIDITLRFKHSRPSYFQIYENLFGKNIEFDTDYNDALINASAFEQPSKFANAETAKKAVDSIKKTALPTVSQSITAAVRNFLTEQDNIPKFPEVADALKIGERTLRRRLSEADISFQHIVNQIRNEKALLYLRNNRRSISDIANSLGFATSSSFSKAFKTWEGVTPKEFRAQAGKLAVSVGDVPAQAKAN